MDKIYVIVNITKKTIIVCTYNLNTKKNNTPTLAMAKNSKPPKITYPITFIFSAASGLRMALTNHTTPKIVTKITITPISPRALIITYKLSDMNYYNMCVP